MNLDAEALGIPAGKLIPALRDLWDLEKEYALRGLIPADPYSLAAVNEADPAFADKYPNGTQWKDASGNYCCAFFDRWRGGRRVSVRWRGRAWGADWWFPVRCKVST